MVKYDSVITIIENSLNRVRKRQTYIYKDKIDVQSLFNAFVELERQEVLTQKALGYWTLNINNIQAFRFDLVIIDMGKGLMVWTYTYLSK